LSCEGIALMHSPAATGLVSESRKAEAMLRENVAALISDYLNVNFIRALLPSLLRLRLLYSRSDLSGQLFGVL
jgi:hypothetical protein